MNIAKISGHLTRNPKLTSTADGVAVCYFSVAVQRPGVPKTIDYIDCVAWRQNAWFVGEHFQKGDLIEVSGVLTTHNYADDKGKQKKSYKLSCNQVSYVRRSPKKTARRF